MRVGTPFTTIDLQQFGVVLKMWEAEEQIWCLGLMESGRTMIVATARMVAAGALMLRRFEVRREDLL